MISYKIVIKYKKQLVNVSICDIFPVFLTKVMVCMIMENLPEIMTIEEVAQYLRVSERTVYEWAQKGKIPCGKLGTIWRFKRDDILNWVDSHLVTQEKKVWNFVPLILHGIFSAADVIIRDNADKGEILHALIDLISEKPEATSKDEIAEGIFHREQLMSTGIGMGIAIPHVRLSSVKDISMVAALVRNGIPDYETLDNIPVKLVFMIISRTDQHEDHLKLVSQLSVKLRNQNKREKLFSCKDSDDFIDILLN